MDVSDLYDSSTDPTAGGLPSMAPRFRAARGDDPTHGSMPHADVLAIITANVPAA